MSTPLTSPAPTPPSGSSNPVPLRSWFKSITDWIAGLSPAGAAAYDTGWIDVPLASGFTFNAQPQVRRLGKTVHWRGDVIGALSAGTTDVAPTANIPPWAQAPRSYRDTYSSLTSATPAVVVQGLVAPAQGLRLQASVAGTHTVNLKGLSGYTVD